MNCPSCQRGLAAGQQACPSCGAALALPVDGALATDPKSRPEPLRELPGRRKRERERNWKDEVKERVDRRRQQATGASVLGAELPLFPEAPPEPPEPPRAVAAESRSVRLGTDAFRVPEALAYELDEDDQADGSQVDVLQRDDESPLQALSLREPVAALPLRSVDEAVSEVVRRRPAASTSLIDEPAEDEWPLDEASLPGLPRPVERPARLAERAQAALLDLGVLASLASIVIYFAGRAAKVPLSGLQPAWPYLLGYLALLGLLYAAYFTGTTGQTLGKMMFDLRVVDTSGQAPGYLRAFGRCALGALGTLVLGLGLVPILFDPARRGFHDRIFRTRVVRPVLPFAR